MKNNQNNNFNNKKLTNLDSITVNRLPSSDNKLADKKHIDDELDKNAILRFNQTLQKYLKVTVGSNTFNLTKYNKIQTTDTTINKYPNIGKNLLQQWNIIRNDRNNNSQVGNFIKSTKTSSPSSESGAAVLLPIGNNFLYLETSSKIQTNSAYVILERTDIIQITNFSFYYNTYSIRTNDSIKSIGRFRIHLLLGDNTCSTENYMAKNSFYSSSSTKWSLLNLDFTEQNYGIRLYSDKIDTFHADVFFKNYNNTFCKLSIQYRIITHIQILPKIISVLISYLFSSCI